MSQTIVQLSFLVFVVSHTRRADSARILVLPMPARSHVFECLSVVDELREHDRFIAISSAAVESFRGAVDYRGAELLPFRSSQSVNRIDSPEYGKLLMDTGVSDDTETGFRAFKLMVDYLYDDCEDMMNDASFLARVKELKFDLAVVDAFTMFPCIYTLPRSLGIPFVSVTTGYEPLMWRIPALPSFTPHLSKAYTDRMTFTERFDNAIAHATFYFMLRQERRTLKDKKSLYLRTTDWMDVMADSELLLINQEPLLSYATPLLPHVVSVGGLTTSAAKPLPEDLEEFMMSATHGVILISFGTGAKHLPTYVSCKIADACRHLKQKVLWKYDDKSSREIDFPENVKLLQWLPQNDILGHAKTKLFITHSGNNGQYESLFHGVPMLAFYVYGDQEHNANRVEHKGFGLKMNLRTFTPESLLRAVNEVLNNNTFSDNIGKASRIFKDMPQTPREKTAFWINHVLKYGGSHLKSHALRMRWYEFLMLDILLVVLLVVFVLVVLTYFTFRALFRIFKKYRSKEKEA